MATGAPPKPIYRKDYRPPEYTVDTVHLDFDLRDPITTVKSTLSIKPAHSCEAPPPLKLDGRSDVKLVYLKVGGKAWPQEDYTLTAKELTLRGLPAGDFQIEIGTEISPEKNTFLEGLYKCNGIFSTHVGPLAGREPTAVH